MELFFVGCSEFIRLTGAESNFYLNSEFILEYGYRQHFSGENL